MGTGIALSGLASGLDTNTMVTQLMALQRQKLTTIEYRQDRASAKKDGLNDVASKLSALKTAADALKSTADGTWTQNQVVESSDPTKVTVAKIAGTGIGGHTIKVDRLASSSQQGFTFGAATFSPGTLKIFAGADPTATGIKSVSVDVSATSTLSDVATAINGSTNSPVSAAVIKDADGKDRLIISSKTTGSAGGFTVDTSALPGNELAADTNYTRSGPTLDAQYELDGSGTVLYFGHQRDRERHPGRADDVKGVTSSAVSVTASAPDVDRTAVKGKIKAFVDAYNTLLANLDAKTTQKPVAKPGSTSDAQQGALYGDTGLASLASQLRQFASQTLSGVPGVTSLADLGISVPKATGAAATADAKLGKLTVDDTILTTALDNDWTKVSSFFDSFAAKADDFVRGYTGTSKSILDGRVKSADADVASFNTQIDDMNLRLTSQETRLRSQFAAMETALSKSQSQSQWLAGQISHLG